MTGAEQIARERARQINDEGWTPEHDADHRYGELLMAARCYATEALKLIDPPDVPNQLLDLWPWDSESWKPSDDPVRNLVKAGALIAAEIDRLI